MSTIDINLIEPRLSSIRLSKAIFIKQNFSQFTSEYKLGPEIGSGSFGKVHQCTHIKTGQVRAVKLIPKGGSEESKTEIATLKKELEILRCLDHPNIVRIYEYYEDAKRFYFIIEYCVGGDLLGKVQELGRVSEQIAARIIKQVLSAVAYCHSNNVVHRDLKPENILLGPDGLNGIIKVTDFGTADMFDPKRSMTTQSGTSFYIAPEVVKNCYTAKCDIWSSGVLLYVLLVGYPPFIGKDDNEIMANVVKGKYTMISEGWDTVSKEAKELIKKMLTYNPDRRISALDALKDSWILKNNSLEGDPYSIAVQALPTLDNLKKYKAVGLLKKATMIYIVSQLIADKEKTKLLQFFHALDVDGDGSLKKKDLVEGYKIICKGIDPKILEKVFDSIDVTKTGAIDYNEFLVAAISEKKILSEINLKEAFNVIDKDQKGMITVDEIRELVGSGKKLSDEIIKGIIKEVNPGPDGKITFDKFKASMLSLAG